MLPRGDEMARGAKGNDMDRAHTNAILDTRTYQVEFAGGKVTEMTANIIAESMHAQCDADRNEYLLQCVLVDYYKNNKVITLKQ